MRPSRVEVDLAAIRHNVRAIAGVVDPAGMCAVIKADAYGHGDVPVAEAVLDAGASWLAVATVEEGIRLREAGIDAPILLLSEPPIADAPPALNHRLTPTVYSLEMLTAIAEAATNETRIHIKLDTGMHRVGADRDAVLTLVERLAALENVVLGGLWTHFPSAEDDPEFTKHQVVTLAELADEVRRRGFEPGIVHAGNSAGALLYPEARFDMVRIGLSLYGCYPSQACRSVVDLRPAMQVVSEVSHVRRLPAGARPTYGRIRALERDSGVATVPIGYADGITRRLAKIGGSVLIGGKRRPFAGIVTMDQIVVETGDDEVAIGDEVVLMGRQGNEEIDVDEWAERLDSVSWEVLCGFGPRLPRRYRS